MARMKLLGFYPVSFFLLILLVFGTSNGSDIIRDSCRESSKGKFSRSINYDFCVASLKAATARSRPSNFEELVVDTMELIKSNTTNMISIISNLLKDPKLSEDVKQSLKDCSDIYSDALSDVDDALRDFKKEHLEAAQMNIMDVLGCPDDCDEHFDDSQHHPIKELNNLYSELNFICASFLETPHTNNALEYLS